MTDPKRLQRCHGVLPTEDFDDARAALAELEGNDE